MEPVPPFWFRQRQGKMEAAGENTYKLTAPNLPEARIQISAATDGGWIGAVLEGANGPELERTRSTYADAQEAWQAAFELYRVNIVT